MRHDLPFDTPPAVPVRPATPRADRQALRFHPVNPYPVRVCGRVFFRGLIMDAHKMAVLNKAALDAACEMEFDLFGVGA